MTFTTVDQTLLGPYQSSGYTFIGTGRNRLINGDMRIDQMNAGNVFNINNVTYSMDQWFAQQSVGTMSTQRLSATPPTGFTNYIRVTVTSADASPAAGSVYLIRNGGPEGTFTRDFLWGTANAKTVTMSFWVRCSITGVFSFSFENSAHTRTYVATYVINSANTWEYKTITVAGDVTGAWPTDSNSFGVRCKWDLGTGSTFSTTPGSWQAGAFNAAIGSTKLISTNGATWDMTGAQLELGTAPTPFEFRLFQQELALCQRYFEKSYDIETAVGTITAVNSEAQTAVQINTNTMSFGLVPFKVTKRSTTPNIVLYSRVTGNAGIWTWRTQTGGTSNERATNVDSVTSRGFNGNQAVTSAELLATGHWTADCAF